MSDIKQKIRVKAIKVHCICQNTRNDSRAHFPFILEPEPEQTIQQKRETAIEAWLNSQRNIPQKTAIAPTYECKIMKSTWPSVCLACRSTTLSPSISLCRRNRNIASLHISFQVFKCSFQVPALFLQQCYYLIFCLKLQKINIYSHLWT